MTASVPLGPIGQIVRSVRDIATSTAWYRDMLGLPLLYSFEGMAFFDCAGTRLYLQEAETPGPESILYFRVPDIAAAHADLLAQGVRFTGAPHRVHRHADGTEEWLAFFLDLEDRPLALIAQIASS